MWVKEFDRNSLSLAGANKFGVEADLVSLLDPRIEPGFERTTIKLPNRILPEAPAFGPDKTHTDLTYLKQCKASFAAGFSEPIPGLVFTPDHAFLIDDGNRLDLIAESTWHSRLFYNQHARCDRGTNWKWQFDKSWKISQVIENEAFIIDHVYQYQYFHWFMDCLPRLWLKNTYSNSLSTVAIGTRMGAFQAQSLAFYGIDPEQCIRLQPNSVVRFERAIVPAFEFAEPLKTIRPGYDSGIWNIGWSQEYLSDLRDKAWKFFQCQPRHGLKIYVSRADAEHRKLVNEPAVLDLLLREGFTVVVPGKLSFAEQVSLFSRAGVIVGPHGAGLTNLLWAPAGCTVIELAPEGLRDVGYRFSSQLCGHRFATVLCRTRENPRGLAYADIEVDIDAFRAALTETFLASRSQPEASGISEALAVSDDMVQALFKSAEDAYAAKDSRRALKLAVQIRQWRPSHYWNLYLLGRLHSDNGNTEAMEEAFRAAIATGETSSVGAHFGLLLSRIRRRDFTDAALLDDALRLCEGDQKRWYFADLHMLKALLSIAHGDFDRAETHLATAYGFRQSLRERDFLSDWAIHEISAAPSLPSRPYFGYLQAICKMIHKPISYSDELAKLQGSIFALEIGAMDGVSFDDLEPFITSRKWNALLVEPTSNAFEKLVENYRRFPNAKCVRLAISNKSGCGTMYRVKDEVVASGELGDWARGVSSLTLNKELNFFKSNLMQEDVQTITFDELIERERINRIDVLHIDTEGHDFVIFKQIDLRRFDIRVIHVELINLDPKDRVRIFDILGAHGYRYYFDGVDVTAVKPV